MDRATDDEISLRNQKFLFPIPV